MTITEHSARRAGRRSRLSWLGELPVLIVLTLLLAALVRTFLVQPFYIPSGSMENTLHVGDRILVDKLSYRFHDVRRGDVVVFNGVDSFTPEVPRTEPGNPALRLVTRAASALGMAPPGETDFVKRVIGLPGDRVACCDERGRVSVNGEPLDERAYLHPGDEPSSVEFDVRVPPGRLWVMGDHRADSLDSRAHLGDPGGGTVPRDKVIGRAFAVAWPLDRLTGVTSAPYALSLGASAPDVRLHADAVPGTERVTP